MTRVPNPDPRAARVDLSHDLPCRRRPWWRGGRACPVPPDPAAELVLDLLRSGTAVSVTATGHSMAPFLRSGDRLTLAPLGGRAPAIGEVLACAVGGRLVVHRLVGRAAGGAVVRGDSAPAADRALPLGDALGVVTRAERDGRRVRLGLGPERVPIAWLSRAGLLHRLSARLSAIRLVLRVLDAGRGPRP